MPNGWIGKILRVNLTEEKIETEDTMPYAEKFIGGQGIAAKIFWDLGCPKVSAFHPDNPLIMMTGPLTGTLSRGAGRIIVYGIAPQSYPKELCTYSSFGGHFPARLKFAGFDGIVVTGAASESRYIYIEDGKVEIRDAEHLWGLDPFETERVLEKEYGKYASVACIGPAGENLSRGASIQHETHSASKGGFGAVMGSKKLKAIVVKGTGSIKVADPDTMLEIYHIEESTYGPVSALLPTDPGFLKWVGGKRAADELMKYMMKNRCSCYGCPCQCRLTFDWPGIGRGVLKCQDSWYGAVGVIGPGVDPENTTYYTEEGKPTSPAGTGRGAWECKMLCDKIGINHFVVESLTAWMWKVLKRGILKTEDLQLPIPYWLGGEATDHEFLTALCEWIASGRKPYAEGTARVAEYFGVESFEVYKEDSGGGRGLLGHGVGYNPVTALQWMMDSTDPARTNANIGLGIQPEVAKFVFGTEKPAYSSLSEPEETVYEDSEIAAIYLQHQGRVINSLPLCHFSSVYNAWWCTAKKGLGDLKVEGNLLSAATGIDMREDLFKIAERIINLERAIVVLREDRTRKDDDVYDYCYKHRFWCDNPWCMGDNWVGPIDREKMEKLKDKYYERRGWDKVTGWPKRSTLEKLGLKDVADKIEAEGKLPPE